MTTERTTVLRHATEAEMVSQALRGDVKAANRFLKYLSSGYPGLRQIMLETLHDISSPILWEAMLHCLAKHSWGDHLDCERRKEPSASQRIDNSIIQAFITDESQEEKDEKEAVIREGMEDPDPRIQHASAYLLGLRGDVSAVPVLADIIDNGEDPWPVRAIRALGRLKDKCCAEPLIRAVASDSERIKQEARRALYALGPAAEPALLEALGDKRPRVRWRVIRTIGELGTLQSALLLAESLCDEDYAVRWAAADVLASLGEKAVPPVLGVLDRHELTEPLREAAIHALRSVQSHQAQERLKPLLEALHGPAPRVEAPRVAQQLLSEWG